MSCVHYKFSSQLNYKTVIFDGLHISLSDLKKQIMQKEKLRAALSDLQITNAQTEEELTDGNALIPRNSSVIVRRIPPGGVKFTRKTCYGVSGTEPAAMETANAPVCLAQLRKTANLAEANASEEEKIKAMMFQSGHGYHPISDGKKPLGPPPASYSCVCCGKAGHSSQNCPRNVQKQQKKFDSGPRIRRSTGIPTSFLMEVKDPNRKGAMLTNRGTYAIAMVHAEAYGMGKREKPPFLADKQSSCSEEEDRIPEEHLCLICKDIMTDAAVIPCCTNSYCDECIRTALLESDDHTCPTCHQHGVSPDALVANKNLRRAIENFQSKSGPRRSLGKQLLPPPLPTSPRRPLVQRNLQPLMRSPMSRQQNPLMAPVTSASAPAVGPDSTVTVSPSEHWEKAHGPLRDAEKQLLPGAALTSKGSGATAMTSLMEDKGDQIPVLETPFSLGQSLSHGQSMSTTCPGSIRAACPGGSSPGWEHSNKLAYLDSAPQRDRRGERSHPWRTDRGRQHSQRSQRTQGPSAPPESPASASAPLTPGIPLPPHRLPLPPGVPPPQLSLQVHSAQLPLEEWSFPHPGFSAMPAHTWTPWVSPGAQTAQANTMAASTQAPPLSRKEFSSEHRQLKEAGKRKSNLEEHPNEISQEWMGYRKSPKKHRRSFSRSVSPHRHSPYSRRSCASQKSSSRWTQSCPHSGSLGCSDSGFYSGSPSCPRRDRGRSPHYRSRSRPRGHHPSRSSSASCRHYCLR